MSTKNTIFEKFRQRMIEHGKYVHIPNDSPLRKILGLEIDETKEVEKESESKNEEE